MLENSAFGGSCDKNPWITWCSCIGWGGVNNGRVVGDEGHRGCGMYSVVVAF